MKYELIYFLNNSQFTEFINFHGIQLIDIRIEFFS
jgi:hypothetical protein